MDTITKPYFEAPPLLEKRPPRCPPYIEISSAEALLPYLEQVAKRPYNQGLHACWDLQPGERVLLRVDNWHDEMVVEACKNCLLYTSPSPRDRTRSRMPSSA